MNFTISKRIKLAFTIILLLITSNLILTSYIAYRNEKIKRESGEVLEPLLNSLNALRNIVDNSEILTRSWVYIDKFDNTPNKQKLRQIHNEEYYQLDSTFKSILLKWESKNSHRFKELYNSISTTITDTLFVFQKEVMSKLSKMEDYEDPIIMMTIAPLVDPNGKIYKVAYQINENIDLAQKMVKSKLNAIKEESGNVYVAFQYYNLISGIIVILSSLFISIWIVKSVVKPLRNAVNFAKHIERGELNFSIEIKGHDEIAELENALNHMRKTLIDVIGHIYNFSEELKKSSVTLTQNMINMSENAQEEAMSAEEISSSIEEITSNIQNNLHLLERVKNIAIHAANQMREINSLSKISAESISKIDDYTNIINELAFQTNILSLNAAVEAARALEHGKGFSVVANEVRKLADKSRTSANEINDLTKQGLNKTKFASEKLNDILPEIENTAHLIEEVTFSSAEQTTNIKNITQAILNLNKKIQENATSAEYIENHARDLSKIAANLKETVAYFKI